MASANPITKIDTEEAARQIRDALRLISICAAAVGRVDAGNHDISYTLGNEVFTALHDALVAIGVEVREDAGCYREADESAGASAH